MVLTFGIPAVLAAVIGSILLLHIADLAPLFSYQAFGREMDVSPVKFTVSLLLIVFALMDLIPYFSRLQFAKDKLTLGGAISGFFGGLSGNQGALRSAFLIKAGLSKEAFVASAAVVSTFVDFTSLSIYATRYTHAGLHDNLWLVMSATLSGISGAFIGNKVLKKVSLRFIKNTIAIMLIALSIAFGLGIL